jgi:hypothetical protein
MFHHLIEVNHSNSFSRTQVYNSLYTTYFAADAIWSWYSA